MKKLFWIFFKIGAFTFGGGYAMVPLIEAELVEKQKLMDGEDFLDCLTIAQSFPGVLAVNISLIIGYRFKRVIGSIVCMLGAVLPSLLTIMMITMVYSVARDSLILNGFFSGVRPVVVALLIYSAIKLTKKMEKKTKNFILLIISFILVGIIGINPVWVILGGGVLSLCLPS